MASFKRKFDFGFASRGFAGLDAAEYRCRLQGKSHFSSSTSLVRRLQEQFKTDAPPPPRHCISIFAKDDFIIFIGEKQSNRSLTEDESLSTVDHWTIDPANLFGSHAYGLKRYSFPIHTNGEKLIEMFGSKVKLTRFQNNDMNDNKDEFFHYQINDADILEKLNLLSNCDVSEIKEICYDTCDKIFSDSSSNSANSTDSAESSPDKPNPSRTTTCPSNLWYHSPSDGGFSRQWKKIDNLKCDMGWWQGNTTDGTKKFDRSLEVQCSDLEPSKMTTLAKVVIGAGAVVGVLLIVVIVIVVVLLAKRKRMHGGETEKKFTIRDSDSKAQTPGGKSTEREKI